jgi:hypothetical protein
MAREGSAGNRGVLLALDVSRSASWLNSSRSQPWLTRPEDSASEQPLEVRQAGSLTSYFSTDF